MIKIDRKLIIITLTFLAASFFTQLPLPLTMDQRIMIAIAFTAAVLWITEALPISVTALLVILLQGIFKIQPLDKALAYIATPVNTLLLAGFIIAAALKKYDLDRRIGLRFISFMGEKTDNLILGVLLATAFLSMWISNTASTAIMLPIGIGIIKKAIDDPKGSNMGKAMVIGIAFTANIGGMGTPVGTPPVPITLGFLREEGIHISFGGWMIRAIPVILIAIPLVWKLMVTVYKPEVKRIPGGTEDIKKELSEMGKLSRDQIHVIILFVIAVIMWLLDPLDAFLPLPEEWIYIASLLISMMFIFPGIGVLDWKEASEEIGWGVFVLVGGGLALGSGLKKTGVIEMITSHMEIFLADTNLLLIVTSIAFITAFSITLFSSLTATSSTFVPVSISLAFTLNENPLLLAPVAGMAACLAFLLPANTPPNALAYKTGYFKTYEMTKAGVLATILCVSGLIIVVMLYWNPLL
ncbi:MAG: DASS family sodium-coupled anion symporter [Candidatus Thermoplasmatota archaeon]|nr:DASS family sodium-coupled anion symporter [Candidatus Thermoplasmatota archaeon]MBS3789494.1 DASS family sodium-coupled anion symporter [Candidatus Thermoplasmatota archaeon]